MSRADARSPLKYKPIKKEIIYTDKAPQPIGPYSQAVRVGQFVFISGQIAIDPATNQIVNSDIEREAHRVMENISAILEAAGLDFTNVVRSTIFLKNMDDFARVNHVYGTYFPEDPPARETVEVARLPKDVHVEISVVAVKG